ncbi:MAG: FAD-dependent oxidoreductase, partial [Anaerovorax sp.]
FERKPAYVYSIEIGDIIEKELDAVTKLGFGAEFSRELCLPFHTEGAIKFPNQAQFDPIKFINGIARGLHIFENTFVEKLSRNTAKTKYGTITADKIIVATHYPMINLAGLYSAKMYQERSYVIALKDAGYVDGMYLDAAKNGMSFRNYKEFLLVGGGGHRTGRDGGGWQVLRDFSEKKYPGAREVYSWAAQDCISLDKIPYIGLLSGLLHEVYVATGFNKWGMTSSMVSASILADMVTGTTNSFAPVFCPGRSMIKKQLSANLLMAAADLASFGAKRCPHLGCALKWNHLEKTWDCPCHGSRFTRTGELLDNPAKRGIKITHPFSH